MSNQINDLFDYGLKIVQNNSYFKFSVDSILLAEFASLKGVHKIVDLCCGNSSIALILSTKSSAKIYGVEYQKEIYNMALESVSINNLSDQIEIINDNVTNYNKYSQLDNPDIVICNPPYFKVSDNSIVNDNNIKSIARHEITIDLEEIIRIASKLLTNKKEFYLVHRVNRLDEIIILCNKYNLNVKKVCLVSTKKDNEFELVLIKAVKNSKHDIKISSININNLLSYKNIF